MGMYNYLYAEITCPICKQNSKMEIEFRIGYLNIDKYIIGDKIRWSDGLKKGLKGKRPQDGNLIDEGYVVCEKCNHDFFVVITIKNDIIVDVKIDNTKKGYIKN